MSSASGDRLKAAKERSRMRKELLKHTLGVDDLAEALGSKTSPAFVNTQITPSKDAFLTSASPDKRLAENRSSPRYGRKPIFSPTFVYSQSTVTKDQACLMNMAVFTMLDISEGDKGQVEVIKNAFLCLSKKSSVGQH